MDGTGTGGRAVIQGGAFEPPFRFLDVADQMIISLIIGSPIELLEEVTQSQSPVPCYVRADKVTNIQNEIDVMLLKGRLDCVSPVQGQFLCNIFTRDKADGSVGFQRSR